MRLNWVHCCTPQNSSWKRTEYVVWHSCARRHTRLQSTVAPQERCTTDYADSADSKASIEQHIFDDPIQDSIVTRTRSYNTPAQKRKKVNKGIGVSTRAWYMPHKGQTYQHHPNVDCKAPCDPANCPFFWCFKIVRKPNINDHGRTEPMPWVGKPEGRAVRRTRRDDTLPSTRQRSMKQPKREYFHDLEASIFSRTISDLGSKINFSTSRYLSATPAMVEVVAGYGLVSSTNLPTKLVWTGTRCESRTIHLHYWTFLPRQLRGTCLHYQTTHVRPPDHRPFCFWSVCSCLICGFHRL